MASTEEIKQFAALREKQLALTANWVQHLLSLAVGALAVLSGLSPPAVSGIERILLACTWGCLGLGIVFGAMATFGQVHLLRSLTIRFQEEIVRSIQEGRQSIGKPVTANPSKAFSFATPVMVVSLLLAVMCLVAFSISSTLTL